MVSVLGSMRKFDHTLKSCMLNTGTIFDLATGCFLPGENGSMILNGGLYMLTGINGRAQTYKSTTSLGYFSRALNHYSEAEGLCYDSEMSLQQRKKRIVNLGNQDENLPLEDRLTFYDKSEMSMEDVFDYIQELAAFKILHQKDLIRETPFYDEYGKKVRSWVPTIVAIDSWSFMSSSKEINAYKENRLGDSKTNTVALMDGKMKSEFMRQMPNLAGSRGIYFVLTAHVGDNQKLDAYAPVNKDVPAMRTSDKLKQVGSQYKLLVNQMIETRKVEPMVDSNGKCQYPSKDTVSDVELQKITTVVCRCKNNVSAGSFDHVISQFRGIQPGLEYYLIIKDCKSDVLTGTQKQKIAIHDTEFTRHNIRQFLRDDYTFNRAMEVLGQFIYVRNRWNIPEIKNMGYMDFCKKMNEAPALKNDILNSTGMWSFTNAKKDRPYMSIFDIVQKLLKQK
jgi:hypothetical protein